MTSLFLRDLPEATFEALRRRARERGSSISVEAIRLIEHALHTEPASMRPVLEEPGREERVARALKAVVSLDEEAGRSLQGSARRRRPSPPEPEAAASCASVLSEIERTRVKAAAGSPSAAELIREDRDAR